MKFATVSKSLVLGLGLLLATSAFAGTKANLQLQGPTNVNGTKLKAGDYKLEWEGTGNVEVSVMQGKNVVAKIPAKVVDLPAASPSNAAVTTKGSDGSSTLAGIRFEGKKYALEVGGSESMEGGSSK